MALATALGVTTVPACGAAGSESESNPFVEAEPALSPAGSALVDPESGPATVASFPSTSIVPPESQASPAEPLPELHPIAEDPSAPATSDALTPTVSDADVEFIPWEEFLTETGASDLIAPLALASVSSYASYRGEDLLLSIASSDGNRRVISLDTKERLYRQHTPHFDCGDCLVAADGLTSVIVAPSGVYAATDGGYRYFLVASNTAPSLENVRALEGQVWVFYGGIWLNAPLLPNQTLTIMPWTRSVASVWKDTGLQVTPNAVNRLHAVGQHEESVTPCPTSRQYYEYGLAFHEGERALVACDGNTLAVTEDFPEQAFTLHELDAPVTWIGKDALATETSYYATSDFETPRGRQGALQGDEQILGYAASTNRVLRVTNLGVWASQLSEG